MAGDGERESQCQTTTFLSPHHLFQSGKGHKDLGLEHKAVRVERIYGALVTGVPKSQIPKPPKDKKGQEGKEENPAQH